MADAIVAAETGEPEAGAAWRSEDGQDLAEYAILIGLIALVVVGAVTLFGQGVVALFQHITGTLPFGGS